MALAILARRSPFSGPSLPLPHRAPRKRMKLKHSPAGKVTRKLAVAMKSFLAPHRGNPAACRAVVTASLSLFRSSCASTVPSKLSQTAAYAVLKALATATEPRDIALGGEGFPESQLAAFLLDATLLEPPPPPTSPIAVPAELTVKVNSVGGEGWGGGILSCIVYAICTAAIGQMILLSSGHGVRMWARGWKSRSL